MIDWTCDRHGHKIVTAVTLGDFDIARKVREGETSVTPYAVGNAMWRSPEGQTGILTRASDIYSLGLVVSFTNMQRLACLTSDRSTFISWEAESFSC